MSRLHRQRLGALLSGVLPALLLAACGEEPTPPRLTGFSPPVLSLPAGETLEISVAYEPNDARLENLQWRVAAGEIEGDGEPTITYLAPADPGEYEIAVTATYGEQDAQLSLDATIKVTQPIATEPPAVVEATAPRREAAEPAAAATGEAAEATAEPKAAVTQTMQPAEEAATATEQGTAPATIEPAEGTPTGIALRRPIERAEEVLEETADAGTAEPAPGVEEVPAGAPTAAEPAIGQASEGAQVARQPAPPAPGDVPPASEEAETQTQSAPAQQVAARTTGAPAAGSRLDRILDKRRLTAIVQIAFEPFSFYGEDGRRTGFEIDFVREFARRWLGDPSAVTYLPVPTDVRIPTLQRERADLIAAALTKTPPRAELVEFSLTYFKDGQRLLVPEASDVADVCHLEGKKVAAVEGSTSLDNIQAAAAECGFELGDGLITFRRHDDAVQALLAGQVEAFTSDGVALQNFAEDRPLKVVGNHFSEEPYGFAVPKGDDRLLQLINTTLRQMAQDGTYAAIYEKWFGDEIRPYPLEDAQVQATGAEAAELTTSSAPASVEPEANQAGAVGEYVVQSGDTLSRIAGKVYGDVSPSSWRRIYEANKDVIGDDPSRIEVGMTLDIPQ